MEDGSNLAGLGHALLIYAAIVLGTLAVVVMRYLPRRLALPILVGGLLWAAYVFVIGALGIPSRNTALPPGIAILLVPVFGLMLAVGLSPLGRAMAQAIPLWILVGLEVFRVGVEIVLAKLHAAGLTPDIMTLEHGNVEILLAISAPLAAILAYRSPRRNWWIVGWNIVGMLSLANVAARAVMTVRGPLNFIHTAVPDAGIILPPFHFIPGMMAPLALLLHILAIRSAIVRSAEGESRR